MKFIIYERDCIFVLKFNYENCYLHKKNYIKYYILSFVWFFI